MKRDDRPLRLVAFDAVDLEPISAALQDAVAQLGDFQFSRREKAFTIAFNRFCWEAGRRDRRVRSGLQIGRVAAARSQNIRQGASDAVVNLLSIAFEPGEPPAGTASDPIDIRSGRELSTQLFESIEPGAGAALAEYLDSTATNLSRHSAN